MIYSKTVKAYKQGGTSINIPTAFCELLNINPGDKLELMLDTETGHITLVKSISPEIFKIQRPFYGNMEDCLIYSLNKQTVSTIPFYKVEQFFKPKELEIYVKGTLSSNNINVLEIINNQK